MKGFVETQYARSGDAHIAYQAVGDANRALGAGSIPGFKGALGREVKSRDNQRMVGMMRDHWWWPWWVSTLIDVGIVVIALVVLQRTSRRFLRAAAVLVALAGVVAAVMAPIVMTDKPNHMKTPTPMMP